ncbi:MAG TPA: hypothetical protein VKE72_09390 [Methylocella sp.]|nr:hypothetical protein [Methylocella sp.]
MKHSKLSLWFGSGAGLGPARLAFALMATLGMAAALAQQSARQQNQDWPCQQILVERISVAAVWPGPPVEGVTWKSDPAVATLVGELAARRTELKDAERMIDEFAKTQGASKAKKLLAVFAGLFETLNDERTQVIDGLLRFGAKQRELAARIRAESAQTQQTGTAPAQNSGEQVPDANARQLQWDMRLFDERRQSVAFACESPIVIEQRLFALARVIQRNLQ